MESMAKLCFEWKGEEKNKAKQQRTCEEENFGTSRTGKLEL